MSAQLSTWDGLSWFGLWAILSVQFCSLCSGTECPWDRQGLLRWSDQGTWPTGDLPRENAQVVIASGKHVLLDVQPVTLSTLTIDTGASLVWGNVDNITLRSNYIHIQGEFHIGSEQCRFQKKARILLIGRSDSSVEISKIIGTKVIAVTAGASLELHGKHKTSWTRLAQTVPAASSVPCGFVYNHADREKFPLGNEGQVGLHVMIWDEVGTVFDFKVFKEFNGFRRFFETVPDRKVIAILAFGPDGAISQRTSKEQIEEMTSVIRGFGGTEISKVDWKDSYSFLARKGYPGTAREIYKQEGQRYPTSYGFLHLMDEEHELDFQVAASSDVKLELFRVQHSAVAYPILTLADEVTGWDVGDQIVVASTDFDWHQAEVRTIIPCSTCSSRQVRVNESFAYLHYGNFTYNVDERAEVGMLTRSIVIEGVMEETCYGGGNGQLEGRLCERFLEDTFGGHVVFLKGFAAAHVQGVELYHVGQQNRLGAYPLHFHVCGSVQGHWFRDNSIHHSFSRCITIHGTHNAEVSGNVCYDFIGHGFFLEDGVEQNNTLDRNLGIGARHGTLLLSDMTKEWCLESKEYKPFVINCDELSVFWLTHPNNIVTNNAAAGGNGNGFTYMFPDVPLGLSYNVSANFPHNPRMFSIKKFEKNAGHSNKRKGIWMDSKIATGKLDYEGGVPMNGIIQKENEYDPHEPPDITGQRLWTELKKVTFYKNSFNMWVKGGNIRVTYSTLADAPEGFGGGTTGTETGTEVSDSIFIGETENMGEPWKGTIIVGDSRFPGLQFNRSYAGQPNEALTAVSMYQGPNFIKSNYFDQYRNVRFCVTTDCRQSVLRHSGAISWKRDNTYPTMTSSYLKDLRFGFCDGDGDQHWLYHGDGRDTSWIEEDGNLMSFVRDADGSLTGSANASVLRGFPMYVGPECIDRPDWGMDVCPYRYIKMEIVGSDGSLSKEKQNKYPLVMSRDDSPFDVPFLVQGTIRNEYLLRVSRSYILEFNTTLQGAAYPSTFTIFGYGVEKGMVVRVGICQPKDVDSFEIRSDYPAVIRGDPTWVDNLQALDDDTKGSAFFYDRQHGILFFKIMSHHHRTNDSQQCPAGMCYKFTVTLNGGTLGNVQSCISNYRPRPFNDGSPDPQTPTRRECTTPDSPRGLGAVNYSEVPYIRHDAFSVPCVQPALPQTYVKTLFGGGDASRGMVEEVGCYSDKVMPSSYAEKELVELSNSMTSQYCADRCYKRGYRIAALWRGVRCSCGNERGSGASQASDCREPCSGNRQLMCGGTRSFSVYTTGRA